MINSLPGWLTVLARVVSVLLAGLILYASLRPSGTSGGWEHSDKIVHFLAYGALGGAAGLGLARHPVRVLAMIVMFGGAIEVLQGAMPYQREASLADGLANTLGAGAGIACAAALVALIIRRPATRREHHRHDAG